MGSDELTADEVHALADAFGVRAAKVLLSMARFPARAVPERGYTTALEVWFLVSQEVSRGVMEDGRRRILEAARVQLPYHERFGVGEGRAEGRRELGVLVVGASPVDLPPVRTDQESRVIGEAARAGRVSVGYAPAAHSTDLAKVRTLRPDILHFVCHGEDGHLMFNDLHGESDAVPVGRLVESLRFYRESAGVRLSGIVLAACDGRTLVPAFAEVAETVIGFAGKLPDPCGIAFARNLYTLLNDTGDLPAAAAEAAHLTAQFSGACAPLVARLLVVGGSG